MNPTKISRRAMGLGHSGQCRGGLPMTKASLDCVPCSLYQGGRPAV